MASSSLAVPRWEASDVLRLLVRDWDLLKQKGKGGWGGDKAWERAEGPSWERQGEPREKPGVPTFTHSL